MCLLVAAIVLAKRRRLKAAAVVLALAAGAKVFALLLAPFVLMRGPRLALGALRQRFGGAVPAIHAATRPVVRTRLGRVGWFRLHGDDGAGVALHAALFDVFAAGLPDMAARVVSVVAFGAFLVLVLLAPGVGLEAR